MRPDGLGRRNARRTKVIAPKTGHVFRNKVTTNDHVTANLCISAEGKFLPTMVIFQVIGPLKSRFNTMASNLGFASPQFVIGKAKFPVILKYAIDQATPLSIQEAFTATGIYPFNPKAIDSSQLVPSSFIASSGEEEATAPTTSETPTTCETCGSFLLNPLVGQGLIPESVANILIPPPTKPAVSEKKKRVVAEGRVITGADMLKQLKEKESNVKAAEEAKVDRLVQKQERKEQKQKDEEEKKNKRHMREEERGAQKRAKDDERMRRALGGKLASSVYTCGVCAVRGRVNDEGNGVAWYGCDVAGCGRWFHGECLNADELVQVQTSVLTGVDWVCKLCEPSLSMEE